MRRRKQKPAFRRGAWVTFDHIYRVNVAVICDVPERFARQLRRIVPDDVADELDRNGLTDARGASGRFVGHRHDANGLIAVIWLSPEADVAIAAHEALHAASWVLGSKGVQFADASEEAFTYYVEWLMRNIVQQAGA